MLARNLSHYYCHPQKSDKPAVTCEKECVQVSQRMNRFNTKNYKRIRVSTEISTFYLFCITFALKLLKGEILLAYYMINNIL